MGLLDRYRRFDDLSPEEVRLDLRRRSREERALARERVPMLDLSQTAWPTFPNTEVINASIAVARSHLNTYPDPHAADVRRAIGRHHGVDPEQIVVGNGAVELLRAAAQALLGPQDELLTPWPSYPVYPRLAREAGAAPIHSHLIEGAVYPEALLGAVTPRTRLVTICNPNDPTGAYLSGESLAALLDALPERVYVLLDEALAHFQTVEPLDAG